MSNVILEGTQEADRLVTLQRPDTFNLIVGREGNDVLISRSGNGDFLLGGPGDDIFYLQGPNNVIAGEGADLVVIDEVTSS